MSRLLLAAAVVTALGACTPDPCERLAETLCSERGEEDARCQARRGDLDQRTQLGALQCRRALFLYQGLGSGGEGARP
ncbi:MAG: hypothetical protein FJ098_08035 [Deltaproteobacteria bacterium]|nr:hypothetical protein [Deltaproteobacteria bacterium]